jgi:hypothetical protein
MSSQQTILRDAEHRYRVTEASDITVARRPARHPCPFCRGVMVGRKTDPRCAVYDTFACTLCPTVICFPPGPAFPDS